MNIEYTPGRHLPALDKLRGLAVLLVIFFHCYPHTVTKFGWVGVDLFFVLSGFLITGILLDSKASKKYYINFIARRTLRIFPLYYFALLVCLIIIPRFLPFLIDDKYDYYINNQVYFWTYSQNWLFSKTGFPENLTLVHFWSLAVEEQFYLFWPLFVKIFNTRNLLKFTILLIAFSVLFRSYIGQEIGFISPYEYMATLSRMDGLLIGAVIAILIRKRKHWLEKYTKYFFVTSLSMVVAGIIYKRSLLFINLSSIFIFIDILAGCLLVHMLCIKKEDIIQKILNQKIFIFLGKYSYGLYVYHYILFMFFDENLKSIINKYINNDLLTFILAGSTIFLFSVGISVLSFKLIEMPFLKMKKIFGA